jgi:deoxyhypusine synthase
MSFKRDLEKAKESIFKQSKKIQGEEIVGPEITPETTLSEFINSYSSIGFQASHLGEAIKIIKKMRKEKAKIYLAYTSGIVSSGLRDIVRQLVEKKLIDVIVTTTGGVEEDLIKTFKPFFKGKFDISGKELRERGINRIGNIFVPNDRYCLYEDWILPILKEILEEQNKGKNITPNYIVKKLGEKIEDKKSIYYWANKNNIPVYLPAPLDGSTGDMVYFFKQSHPELKIDVTQDLKDLIDYTIQQEKTGLIVLGAGVIKHHVCNANLFRDGADYAVYINAAQEFDGSDAGATPNEAMSWGKIKSSEEENTTKVYSDATLAFPLIAAEAFDLIKR